MKRRRDPNRKWRFAIGALLIGAVTWGVAGTAQALDGGVRDGRAQQDAKALVTAIQADALLAERPASIACTAGKCRGVDVVISAEAEVSYEATQTGWTVTVVRDGRIVSYDSASGSYSYDTVPTHHWLVSATDSLQPLIAVVGL